MCVEGVSSPFTAYPAQLSISNLLLNGKDLQNDKTRLTPAVNLLIRISNNNARTRVS